MVPSCLIDSVYDAYEYSKSTCTCMLLISLSEWSKWLSKKSLVRHTQKMRENCNVCTAIPCEHQLGILAACLISVEPHASFNVLTSETSNREQDKKTSSTPLNTPQDASVTHILVIPNSTTVICSFLNQSLISSIMISMS